MGFLSSKPATRTLNDLILKRVFPLFNLSRWSVYSPFKKIKLRKISHSKITELLVKQIESN
jgi:hypothetical protein